MTIRPKTRRRVLILLSAITLLLTTGVGLYLYRQHQSEREAQHRRAVGLAAYERGDYDAAIEELSYYDFYNSADAEVFRALARSHDRARPQTAQHRAAALRFYRQAFQLEPGHEPTATRLVELSAAYGQYEQAINLTQRLLEKSPHDPQLLEARFASLAALSRHEQLMEETAALLDELEPDHPAHAVALERRVQALHELGRNDRATEAVRELLALDPDRFSALALAWRIRSSTEPPDALLQWARELHGQAPDDPGRVMILALAHRRAGRIPDAIDLLERVASLEPENPLLVRSLAPALASVGRMGLAADVLLELHPDASSPGLVAEAARFLALAGRGDRLLELTQHAEDDIEALPIEAIGLRALALFETGRDAEARSLLDPLSQDAAPPTARAWAQALSGRFGDDATDSAARIRRLREALSLRPDHLWAHAWLAEVYRRVGENELAARHLARAVAVEPGWLPPRLALAELLRQSGELEASLEQARRAWMLAPRSSPVAARAFVTSAARLPDVIDTDTRQRLLALSEQLLGSLGNDPELTAARARLLHTHEGTQAAARFVRSQLPNADASVLRELLAVNRELDLGLRRELARALVDRASDADGDARADGDAEDEGFADAEADALRRIVIDSQNPGLAAEAIADLLEQAPYRDDPAWWARYARALDAAGDPRAMEAWRRAVAFDEEDPRVLRAALDSASVLAEPDWYRQLTGRLRSMTADDAVGWKVAEARYLLTHEPGATAASRARGLLREVVDLAPRRREALLLLAEANGRLGRRDDQRAALERAFQEFGYASAEPGLRLVDLYQAAGESDRADAVLDRLSEAGRYSTAEVRRIARKLLASARLRDALQLLDDHATAEPESSQSLLPMRADLHLALGRTDRAVELYEDALDDAEPETLRAAVRFFARLGEIQRARGLLDRLSKIDPTNALKMRVEFASRWGEAGELERMLDTALEREPEAAWVHRAMLQYRWQRDEVDAVAAALERAREGVPGDASFAAMEQALPLVRSFADHASMRILFGGMLDAGRESESLLEAMRVLAAVQRGEAEPEAAASELASLAAAARVEPLTAVAAGMLADTGRTRAAAELASSRMRAVGSPRLAEIAARAWMALGDPASALPAAFAWHQRDPNSPRATAMIVRASAALGKRQERFLARLASTLDELVSQPDPALAELREVSLAMLAAGRDSSLRTALEPRLEDDAAWRRLWLQLALEAVDDAASRSDATPWIDPLLDHVEPSDPDEVAALCNALRRLGERIEDGAFAATRRDLARKALERAPRHAGLLRQLALAHEQLGETERAADAYQRVLESDPDDVVSMNNLAVLLSELGRDLDQALSLVDRAISRYPELSALHDTRGQVLAAMGRADDAIQAYETAISLQPESLKWRVNLARHLAATQKWQRTREVLNEIESIAGQREDGVPRTLRDEYLAIREAARNAE